MKQPSLDPHCLFADFFPEERIRPFAYLLSKRLQEGHICISERAVLQLQEEIPYSIRTLPDWSTLEKWVTTGDTSEVAPFVKKEDRLYLQRYYRYETLIVNKLIEFARRSRKHLQRRREEVDSIRNEVRALAPGYSLEGLTSSEKTDWQLVAVIQCLLHDFSIITGGPGTGKTTTLAHLLKLILTLHPEASIALAAPTGKASMRMLQSLTEKSRSFPSALKEKIAKLRSHTIHTLLGYQPGSLYFKHDETNRLPYDWIIIDEASMIDMPLFAKLLMALGERSRLVLLGDKDQLASVEAGSLFGDLCESVPRLNRMKTTSREWINGFIANEERAIGSDFILKEEEHPVLLDEAIIELKLSHRFQERGEIGQLSKAVIQNDQSAALALLDAGAKQEIVFVSHKEEEVFKEFVKGYSAYLLEKDIKKALEKLNSLRVLVSVRQGSFGLHEVNRKIEKVLSDMHRSGFQPSGEYYVNRPVMITRNNHELGLYNGDVGIIRPDKEGRLRGWFLSDDHPGGVRPVLPAYLSGCETVFAMTIHKSQGSEFDQVMVILPDQTESLLLTRELIYTAITRARSNVILQATKESLLAGMIRSVERSSGLQERLNK